MQFEILFFYSVIRSLINWNIQSLTLQEQFQNFQNKWNFIYFLKYIFRNCPPFVLEF